ncbi:Ldh family oxidoreductase [Phycicoccus sp. Soil802]|uniref:Ldh family oxidoreductase n=1 Tax=Phycicoccus sp. Soil802 TaxID=1736414 RepID=UPI0007032464|nr:hypothetical protein ASG91_19035 [Phycicoccus sp. Soil802]
MKMPISEAFDLAVEVLRGGGLSRQGAEVVAAHLVDAHCTGHTFAGLPRIPTLLEGIGELTGGVLEDPEVIRETATTAWVDGKGSLGYIACQKAIELGIAKGRDQPVVIVGACNAYYSGRLGYYAEQAARAGHVVIHTNSSSAAVAAPGGTRPVLGTNPFCISFPTNQGELTVDFSTAAITEGAVRLAAATGEELPPGAAIDGLGRETSDPQAALAGAILPWGGHKGFALSMAVAALGVLAGGAALPNEAANHGYIFVLVRADTFLAPGEFQDRLDLLIDYLRDGAASVRIPGEQSSKRRDRARSEGFVEVPDEVLGELRALRDAQV